MHRCIIWLTASLRRVKIHCSTPQRRIIFTINYLHWLELSKSDKIILYLLTPANGQLLRNLTQSYLVYTNHQIEFKKGLKTLSKGDLIRLKDADLIKCSDLFSIFISQKIDSEELLETQYLPVKFLSKLKAKNRKLNFDCFLWVQWLLISLPEFICLDSSDFWFLSCNRSRLFPRCRDANSEQPDANLQLSISSSSNSYKIQFTTKELTAITSVSPFWSADLVVS